MEYQTENVERILSGHTSHLSNDDISMILVELVEKISQQEKRIKSLESELYSLGGLVDTIAENQPADGDGLYGGLCDDY